MLDLMDDGRTASSINSARTFTRTKPSLKSERPVGNGSGKSSNRKTGNNIRLYSFGLHECVSRQSEKQKWQVEPERLTKVPAPYRALARRDQEPDLLRAMSK
jgi:hypothetical protein